jgi:hypothetical protein
MSDFWCKNWHWEIFFSEFLFLLEGQRGELSKSDAVLEIMEN